jgi:predicted O-linked N-acetylglucosamine transferase (SPINDLY family)
MMREYNEIRGGKGAFAETGRKTVFAAGMKGEGNVYDSAEELLKAEGALSLYMRKVISFKEPTQEFIESVKEQAGAIRELANLQSDPKLIKGYLQIAEEIETGTELNKENLQVVHERENAMKSLAATLNNAAEAEKTYTNAMQAMVGKQFFGANLKSGAQGMIDVVDAQIKQQELALDKISGGADLESDDPVIRGNAEKKRRHNFIYDVGGHRTQMQNLTSRKD